MDDDIPCLRAALRYAEWGWRVLPLAGIRNGACTCLDPACDRAGKHPCTRGGLLDATTDAERIRQWFLRRPSCNVGIAAGASSLAVLDVDFRKGGRESLQRLGVDTRGAGEVATGNGFHLYYAGTTATSVGELGPGLDVRSLGGYVVAPPSRHVSGAIYTWKRLPNPLPPWPFPRKVAPEPAPPIGAMIFEGRRNAALFSLGATLHYKGLEPEVVRVALRTVNREVCKPPLESAEVEDIAAKVLRRPRAGPGLQAVIERLAGRAGRGAGPATAQAPCRTADSRDAPGPR